MPLDRTLTSIQRELDSLQTDLTASTGIRVARDTSGTENAEDESEDTEPSKSGGSGGIVGLFKAITKPFLKTGIWFITLMVRIVAGPLNGILATLGKLSSWVDKW